MAVAVVVAVPVPSARFPSKSEQAAQGKTAGQLHGIGHPWVRIWKEKLQSVTQSEREEGSGRANRSSGGLQLSHWRPHYESQLAANSTQCVTPRAVPTPTCVDNYDLVFPLQEGCPLLNLDMLV